MLPKKHGELFPEKPRLSSVIVMFQDAHAKLAGRPEFEAMRQKISAVDKAVDLLRGIKSAGSHAAELRRATRELFVELLPGCLQLGCGRFERQAARRSKFRSALPDTIDRYP